MEAFCLAVETWGVDMLEMDARLSADGEVVLMHDATVDRTCNGTGAVARLTWDRLRTLDAGYHFRDLGGQLSFRGSGVRIPRLDDVLEAFSQVRINVEAKSREVAGPLLRIIRRHRAEHRVLFAAEVESNRRDARGYEGPWGASRRQIALFWGGVHTRMTARLDPRFDVLQVPEVWNGIRVVAPRFLDEAHRMNLAVHVWVVDQEHEMRRLLSWGVDGIQTDRLDVLSRVLSDVAGRPPPPRSGIVP